MTEAMNCSCGGILSYVGKHPKNDFLCVYACDSCYDYTERPVIFKLTNSKSHAESEWFKRRRFKALGKMKQRQEAIDRLMALLEMYKVDITYIRDELDDIKELLKKDAD